jgi:hypothetical protein
MSSRRGFIGALAVAALPTFRPEALRRVWDLPRSGAGGPDDEDFWVEIQRAFDADRTMVNLNNGGCSPCPTHVLDQMIRDLRFSNELPVIHMWQTLEPRVESVRRDLAREFGCDAEEMAITRNASEANEIMIFGLDLKPGDEIVVTNQNYPRMLTSWDQRVRRDGVVLKQVSFKLPPPSPQYIVDRFKEAVTARTRVIEVTHITNLSGQIMPVRELVDFARPRGIEVFVDGAHAFGQFPFKRDDLRCDYYGTSLHKWLLAPDRHRLSLRPSGEAESAVAADGGTDFHGWEHPQVRGDRHPPGGEPQCHRRCRWPSIAGSARSGRSRASAICGTAGPPGSGPRAIG